MCLENPQTFNSLQIGSRGPIEAKLEAVDGNRRFLKNWLDMSNKLLQQFVNQHYFILPTKQL